MKTTHIVEAALFSAGKPISIEEIAHSDLQVPKSATGSN